MSLCDELYLEDSVVVCADMFVWQVYLRHGDGEEWGFEKSGREGASD